MTENAYLDAKVDAVKALTKLLLALTGLVKTTQKGLLDSDPKNRDADA